MHKAKRGCLAAVRVDFHNLRFVEDEAADLVADMESTPSSQRRNFGCRHRLQALPKSVPGRTAQGRLHGRPVRVVRRLSSRDSRRLCGRAEAGAEHSAQAVELRAVRGRLPALNCRDDHRKLST